jgi:hypothetical protein
VEAMMKANGIEEYVMLRDKKTDYILAVSVAGWNDYMAVMRNDTRYEEIVRGERGDITMLEQFAKDQGRIERGLA